MRRPAFHKTVVIITAILGLTFSSLYAGNKVRTIVVFFSLNPNLPAYHNFLDGLKSSLLIDKNKPCTILTEYLDVTRSVKYDYIKHIVDIYNTKAKETRIDLYITAGAFTYSFLKEYGLKFNIETPVIRIENDPPISGSYAYQSDKNVLEIPMKFKVNEALQQAVALFPDRHEILVVTGNSASDQYYMDLTKKASERFIPARHFTYYSGIGYDSLISVVRKISKTCIIFLPIYLSGKDKIPFTTPEVGSYIANNCNVPVIPLFDSFDKSKGELGGFVFSFEKVGEETGRCALKILDGTPVSSILPDENSFSLHMFDWQELKRWNLLKSKAVPPNSIFFNKEFNFFHKYRWYFLGLLIFLISQGLLIIYLILINKKQKQIAFHRSETEKLYSLLIREDRLATMVELTASFSHELNQPLTGILFTAEAGKKYLKSGLLDPVRAEKLFNNIIEDENRASDIISSIRSLMKLETREKEKVDLTAIVRETLNLYHSELNRQNIKIRDDLGNIGVHVIGDKVQLQQVLLNLLTNAARAMEMTAAGNKLIIVSLSLNDNHAVISVRDSGTGISEETNKNLFNPFFSTKKSGLGIGLALCKSIVQSHQGAIWAENISGGGAEFSFKIPAL